MNDSNNAARILTIQNYCDRVKYLNSNFPMAAILQSVFFDVIPGMISTGFIYRFYQKIEISHPVYSILFTNIVFTTFLSYANFSGTILIMILYRFINICPIFYLFFSLNTSCPVINIVSLMTIAILRYHFMITTKMMRVDDEVNIQKIRWVALAFNWSLAVLLFTFRGISLIPSQIIRNATNISSAILYWVMSSIVLITTVGIYLKLGRDLKTMKKVENEEKVIEENQIKTSDNRSEDRNECNGIPVGLDDNARKDNSNENTKSASLPISVSSRIRKTNQTRENQCQHICCAQNNLKYGGIYVGNDSASKNKHFNTVCNSTKDTQTIHELGGNLQGKRQETYKLQVGELHHFSMVLDNMSYVHSIEKESVIPTNRTPSPIDKSTLPSKEQCKVQNDATVVMKVDVETNNLKPDSKHILDITNTSNVEHQKDTGEIEIPQLKHSLNLETINVVGDCQEAVASQRPNAALENNYFEESENDNTSSKEGKSIKKSILISFLYLSFLALFIIITHVNDKHQETYIMWALIAISLGKIYRTFATIVTSIFCFELVQSLFAEIIEDDLVGSFQIFCGRIRSAL